jgi:transposase-like protein
MDDLKIQIILTYKVPEKDLTLNGLLRGLERDRDEIMRTVLGTILAALEEKTLENLPGRFVRNGHQSSARTFKTSFGIVRHRMAQVRDTTGAISCPLEERLQIVPYRQYQGEELEAAVGQAIHLSYRVAVQETQRLKGQGPSKSTLWRRLQDLAETAGAWPPLKHRPFQFLMVDGTKVRLQDEGHSAGKAEMRWALASEDVGKPFELVGFWVDKDWAAIRQDLARRLNYRRLRVLFSDGGPGIAENLLTDRMDQQRCVWHGKHDFRYLLYADQVKGDEQRAVLEILDRNPLFHLSKDDLEALAPGDAPTVRKLVETIRCGFAELLAALPAEKYPKTRTYLENFAGQAMVFFDYWLDHQRWLPITTNALESAFSRVANRIKRIGRRWSENGLLNWLMIAFRKIFQPKLWAALWDQYLRHHRRLQLVSLRIKYRWINAIT